MWGTVWFGGRFATIAGISVQCNGSTAVWGDTTATAAVWGDTTTATAVRGDATATASGCFGDFGGAWFGATGVSRA